MASTSVEDFEDGLARLFLPTYRSSQGESEYLAELEPALIPRVRLAYPPWRPHIYASVLKLAPSEDVDAYEINYLSIWDRDTGGILGPLSNHIWDTERTAALVVGPKGETNPDGFRIRDVYFAAHEGTAFDSSTYRKGGSGKKGPVVFWSLGKHASYPDEPPRWHYDVFKGPGETAEPGACTVLSAGTALKPSPKAPWVGWKEGWGPDGITPVYDELSARLWNPKTLARRKKGELTKEDVRAIQESIGLEPTGVIDPATYKRANHLDPALVRNASNMNREALRGVVGSRGGERLLAGGCMEDD